jgi:hypothetical protein
LVNTIYRFVFAHNDSVRHIQALFLWNRPVLSAIFLVLVELVFIGISLLPFSKTCILCLSAGAIVLVSSVHGAFPRTFTLLTAFDIPPTVAGSTNRIRTAAEISAFVATVLSVWTRFAEFVFQSVVDAKLTDVVVTVGLFALAFLFAFIVGDFVFLWIWFHATFVVPGVILLPPVQRWLNGVMADDEEPHFDGGPANLHADNEVPQPEGQNPSST